MATDPALATTFAHLNATTAVLSMQVAELGIYPAVNPSAFPGEIDFLLDLNCNYLTVLMTVV